MSLRNCVKAIVFSWVIMICILSFLSCSPRLSGDDVKRIAMIHEKYGKLIKIKFERDTYVNVNERVPFNRNKSEDIAKDIYSMFFFDNLGSKTIRPTKYVYLNVYDNEGQFKYQIVYDSNKDSFTKSFADHY